MENIRQVFITNISMATFLQATKHYCNKHIEGNLSDSKKNYFTDLAEDALDKHVWKCYLPTSKMGKSRVINSNESDTLLQDVRHIDDIHLINHYKNMPLSKLESIFIMVVFFTYYNDEVTENLQNALYIKSILKPSSRNGSIDTLTLEKKFEEVLKRSRKTNAYINRLGNHPLAAFLNINPRTLKSFGGCRNAKK